MYGKGYKLRGDKNGRYIKLSNSIINEILYLYNIEKININKIRKKLNLSYGKVKSIINENI